MLIIADENIPLLDAFFADIGEIRTFAGRHMSANDIKGADALLVRSVTQVDESLLAGTHVGFVASATIGTDHIDLDYLRSRSIGFANAPGCNAESVADYVISALLNLAELHRELLTDKRIGVIGVGNVGSVVASRLKALGCEVFLNDPPRQQAEPKLQSDKYGFVDLNTLLATCDVVCMHAPLTLTGDFPSFHLIGSEQLSLMKKGAWLLNAGRGAVVDNHALKSFLNNDQVAIEVILDVWEPEPCFDRELLRLIRWGTPHIAGYSLEGRMRGTEMVYQAFCQHFGLELSKALDDFLPVAPTVTLAPSTLGELSTRRVQHFLLDLVNQCYDIKDDDLRLRQTLTLSSEDVGGYFDALRKNYPQRRQYNACQVLNAKETEKTSELHRLLHAVGFKPLST